MDVVVGLLVLAAAGAGVAVGRAWGRASERAGQAQETLDRLRRDGQISPAGLLAAAGAAAEATTLGAAPRWSDLPPRGEGICEPATVAAATAGDAERLLADFTRPMEPVEPEETLAAHGQLPEVPPPPPIRLDVDDALDVHEADDDPPRDETRVTSRTTERATGEPRPRYPWPHLPHQSASTRRGVMPSGWMSHVRRALSRPPVRIRKLGAPVQGWAPGQVTALMGAAGLTLAATVPSERLWRAGKGAHTKRRVRQEQRRRAQAATQPMQVVRPRRSLRPQWRDMLRPARRSAPVTVPSVGCVP